MLSSDPLIPTLELSICCANPNCSAPLNPFGRSVCQTCQTPLVYRYLWVVGPLAEELPGGAQVAGRYHVYEPYVWLDTQPGLPPEAPIEWPDNILPYLHLAPLQLHLPTVYGFCPNPEGRGMSSTFFLDNVPLDGSGRLLPGMMQQWPTASAVRQVYWLWQMLDLWEPLLQEQVAASLLPAENLRVDGWRIRLVQLLDDRDVLAGTEITQLELADLANVWISWQETTQGAIAPQVYEICQAMKIEGVDIQAIKDQLNHLFLAQAAQLPLTIDGFGLTDPGSERPHNEDTCYPIGALSVREGSVAIVCDGIGGHEGGEVASQLAVQSLKLQVQALIGEVTAQPDLLSPDQIAQQLAAMVRVANNLIAAQNDAQGRADRRRMGTTLVMAVQLPQAIATEAGELTNAHELYLVHVGDSRAYWLTASGCHRLTVDDDVAMREVRMGRSLYYEAIYRSDAGALTQALGTKEADFLHPTVQRFVIEEEGILLLCSDGLSDNDFVEQTWPAYSSRLLNDHSSLATVTQAWLDQAKIVNGHDNLSLVLLRCLLSSRPVPSPVPSSSALAGDSIPSDAGRSAGQTSASTDWESDARSPESTGKPRSWLTTLAGILLFLGLLSGLGVILWSQSSPSSFQQFRERISPSSSSPSSP